MQAPAPKGIVVVDEENRQAETKIANEASQMGIPTTRQTVSPDQSHVLEGVKELGGEILHDADAFVEETVGKIGGGVTYIRTGEAPTDIVEDRQRKGGRIVSILNKLGLKKAA